MTATAETTTEAVPVPRAGGGEMTVPTRGEDRGVGHFDPWLEDERRRRARAMLEQLPPYRMAMDGQDRGGVDGPLPLRSASTQPSVAWDRFDDVTGRPITVPRIGCRRGGGSSDW